MPHYSPQDLEELVNETGGMDDDGTWARNVAGTIESVIATEPEMLAYRLNADLGWTCQQVGEFLIALVDVPTEIDRCHDEALEEDKDPFLTLEQAPAVPDQGDELVFHMTPREARLLYEGGTVGWEGAADAGIDDKDARDAWATLERIRIALESRGH